MPNCRLHRFVHELVSDRRGAVASEYLIATAMMIVVAIAMGSLAPTIFSADQRAQTYLRANSP